jgi:predicted DNA-binding transcriptional regulator AlpA
MIEPLLTAREVAETFGFSGPGWVLEQSRGGRRGNRPPLPSFRLGGTFGPVRFRASEVEAWLQELRTTRASA